MRAVVLLAIFLVW